MYEVPKSPYDESFDCMFEGSVLRIQAVRKEITNPPSEFQDPYNDIICGKIKIDADPIQKTYQGILTVSLNDTQTRIQLIGQLDERFILMINKDYHLQNIFQLVRDNTKQALILSGSIFKITIPQNITLQILLKKKRLDIWEKWDFKNIKFDEYLKIRLKQFQQELVANKQTNNLKSQINRQQQQIQTQSERIQQIAQNIEKGEQSLEKQQEQIAEIQKSKILEVQNRKLKGIEEIIKNNEKVLQQYEQTFQKLDQIVQTCLIEYKKSESTHQQNQMLIESLLTKKNQINEVQLTDLRQYDEIYLTPIFTEGVHELKFEYEEDFEYQIGILEEGNPEYLDQKIRAYFLQFPSCEFKRGDEKGFDIFTRQLFRRDIIGIRVNLDKKQFTVSLNNFDLPPFNLRESFSSFAFALQSNQKIILNNENKYEIQFQ